MPQRTLYPQFRDQFEATKYPFGDRAALVNAAGRTILEGTFLDAHLYPIGAKESLYLARVVVSYTEVEIWIGDVNSDSLASAKYSLADTPDNLRFRDAYGRAAGILVSQRDRLAMFQTWGVGTHVFKIEETEFVASCCMPTPEIGVRGIMLESGEIFTDNVRIVGDAGVVVRLETVQPPKDCVSSGDPVDVIRVDIVGDQLFRRRLCDSQNMFTTPNPVRTIRVRSGGSVFECPPNAFGNMTIQMNDNLAADTALRVRTTEDGIVFEAVGSKTTETINAWP